MRNLTKSWKMITLAALLLCSFPSYGVDRLGRLGVGFNNQLKTDLPALSIKLQRSKSFAIGALMGLNTDSDSGGFGAGIKVFRNLFEEPQLHFYTALLGAYLNDKALDETGFQIDATLGSEFSFAGLTSIGFSFEFGFSFNKLDDFIIETVGDSFIVAGVHFYL